MILDPSLQAGIATIQKGELAKGTELVKVAAEKGNVQAIMLYAQLLFSQNKQGAYQYLDEKAKVGVPGVLHRLSLMRVFFDTKKLTAEDVMNLHAEASRGHVESLLVLINYLADSSSLRDYYILLLGNISQDLISDLQLTMPEPNTLNEPDSEELITAVLARWERLTNLPSVTHSEEIALHSVDGFISVLEMEYFKIRFAGMLRPSVVAHPETGEPINDPIRDSATVNITPDFVDWFTMDVERRIAAYTDTKSYQGESFNLLNYQPGQQYKPHYDAFLGDSQGVQNILQDGGQRVKTAICYLNSVEKGGETHFSRLNIKLPAKAGQMIYFSNVDESHKLLNNSYHAGLPVQAGDKWILTKWIRESKTRYGNLVYRK